MAPLTQRKLAYAASVAAAALGVIVGVMATSGGDPGALHLLIAALVCLVPGRVNGFLWRDAYRSRRLLDLKRFAEAEAAATRAITAFRQRPWIRHARWWVGMVHTRHPEAMVRNNRAVARIARGDLDRASGDLVDALAIDPTYALAHANLAGLLAATGDDPGSAMHQVAAHALGLRRDEVEGAIAAMGSLLATLEGHPPSA